MNWQDILSIVGIFLFQFIFVVVSYLYAVCMDVELYDSNKYNEARQTIRIGLRWIFWRCKKDNNSEIFIIAFIHETISLAILLGVIVELILSILLNIKMIYMVICSILIFIYCLYCVIIYRIIKKR